MRARRGIAPAKAGAIKRASAVILFRWCIPMTSGTGAHGGTGNGSRADGAFCEGEFHCDTPALAVGRVIPAGHSRSEGQDLSKKDNALAAVDVRQSPPAISFLKKSPLPIDRIEIA